MSYESFENYQYNSCISRGICSINPKISALQTIIVLYLRLFAKFAINLEIKKEYENFILNTIAITINNPEFNENSFLYAVKIFKKILPEIIIQYLKEKNVIKMEIEERKAQELFVQTNDIITAIKFGEKILNQAIKEIPSKIRDLYNVMLIISKSMSINLLDLKSYDKNNTEAFSIILKLLSYINLEEKNIEILKSEIYKASDEDVKLMKNIREAQEERYGIQSFAEVSYTTIPNKAVLVVGSNLRELENILEAFKNKNIDVYTHDEMMLAHTFPKFASYKELKGQYGFGIENCLLDFATFPGPIILTKNSLHNIENFYRGRLFTTDYSISPKGIIKIEKDDFSNVIQAAESTKGFKKGKVCESITIGFDYQEIISKIELKLKEINYKKVIIIGLDGYSLEQKAYFEKLIKHTDNNILVISFSYNIEKDNVIYINSCFDNYSWIKIFNYLEKNKLKTTVFIPKCERNTISQLIYLSQIDSTKIYIGKCTPIVLNPSLLNTLQNIFAIKNISTAKNDLEQILEDK